MNRIRVIMVAAVAILAVIIVLQNTKAVETKLLFMTITMPRAVLLFVTLLVGFALGIVAATWMGRKPVDRARETDKPE